MLVQRITPEHSTYNPVRSYNTMYVWSSDGWTYDISGKVRMRYTTDGSALLATREITVFPVITDVQYKEEIEVSILSENPLVWKETSSDLLEVYASLPTNTKPF